MNADPVTLLKVLRSLFISLTFGSLSMLIYRFYHRKTEVYDLSIARSFPIIAPSVTSIFLMIQSSLPLSLGLLGALSFVRFRSPVKRAEDVGFILVIISGGISCAVNQYYVGFLLLALLGAYDFVRRAAGKGRWAGGKGNIAIHSSAGISSEDFNKTLFPLIPELNLVSLTYRDNLNSFVFSSNSLNFAKIEEIKKTVSSIDPKARVEFFFPDNQLGL